MNLNAWVDGGSKGNPGPSSIGVVIKDSKSENVIKTISAKIGNGTNSEAEYKAVIRCLEEIYHLINKGLDVEQVLIYTDSLLIFNQICTERLPDGTGIVNPSSKSIWKIKNSRMKALNNEVHYRLSQLNVDVKFRHIRREFNKEADKLVQDAK